MAQAADFALGFLQPFVLTSLTVWLESRLCRDEIGGIGDTAFTERVRVIAKLLEDVPRQNALNAELPELVLELLGKFEHSGRDRLGELVRSELVQLFFGESVFCHRVLLAIEYVHPQYFI